MLHSYVATRKLLYKMNIKGSPRCNFCILYNNQDIEHLIFLCINVKKIWFRIKDWLFSEFNITKDFTLKDILFGSLIDSKFLNKIVLHCKYFILKCKCKDILPNIEYFTEYVNLELLSQRQQCVFIVMCVYCTVNLIILPSTLSIIVKIL